MTYMHTDSQTVTKNNWPPPYLGASHNLQGECSLVPLKINTTAAYY